MSFCNFNSKSDGRRYHFFFFHLIAALPFPLQNLVQRLRSQTPSSVSSTPNEVSAIPCKLFGNPLRALFLKNRDFFWYCEIFLPNTRGPLWWPRVTIGKLLRFYQFPHQSFQFQSLFLYLIFQRKNKRKIKLDWNLKF